jgi:SpoVK/Ycf46/Vps4 family AAA+-type ATPase
MRELVTAGGIVVVTEYPKLLNAGLPHLRRIEPDRPMIVIYEDIDEMIRSQGEHDILALLDGENQVGNVVNIATTNYPELLGERIVNRPSRFDERIHIGMPSASARSRYLQHATRKEALPDKELARWVNDTNGMSIAHLRELIVATFCLGQQYEDVIERLRGMAQQPKSGREFAPAGFGKN